MAIPVISKIIQKNNMKFKLMDSANVSYDGTEEVSVKDKIDEVLGKVKDRPSIIISDTEPTDQSNGDIWIENI